MFCSQILHMYNASCKKNHSRRYCIALIWSPFYGWGWRLDWTGLAYQDLSFPLDYLFNLAFNLFWKYSILSYFATQHALQVGLAGGTFRETREISWMRNFVVYGIIHCSFSNVGNIWRCWQWMSAPMCTKRDGRGKTERKLFGNTLITSNNRGEWGGLHEESLLAFHRAEYTQQLKTTTPTLQSPFWQRAYSGFLPPPPLPFSNFFFNIHMCKVGYTAQCPVFAHRIFCSGKN